ncbi:Rpn family recombination-promoting nuclease/putative transposase, partial [Spirochaeta dissipatitropha]
DRMKAKPAGTAVPLRPVLPILFYHGPQRELPDRFSTAMLPPDLHPADLENQPDFSVHVFNLATLPDEKIQGSLELQAALFAMKYARRNFNLLLRKLNELAKNGGLLLIHSPRF